MSTPKAKPAAPEAPAMTHAPQGQRTTQEIDAEIADTEAHLEALRRERAYQPFPKALYREAAPPAAPKVPRFTPKAAEPVDIETVVVYSEAGVAAAEAEGYTEDLESLVEPETPPTEPPADAAAPSDHPSSRY